MNNLTEKNYLNFLGVNRDQLKEKLTNGGGTLVTDVVGFGILSGLNIEAQETPSMSVVVTGGVIYNHLGVRKVIPEIVLAIEPIKI